MLLEWYLQPESASVITGAESTCTTEMMEAFCTHRLVSHGVLDEEELHSICTCATLIPKCMGLGQLKKVICHEILLCILLKTVHGSQHTDSGLWWWHFMNCVMHFRETGYVPKHAGYGLLWLQFMDYSDLINLIRVQIVHFILNVHVNNKQQCKNLMSWLSQGSWFLQPEQVQLLCHSRCIQLIQLKGTGLYLGL